MNTFHVSFGEMTITLDDVPTLVGITVMGLLATDPGDWPIQKICLLIYLVCWNKMQEMSWGWSVDPQ